MLNNLMMYADRERKLISGNPLKSITWTEPRKLKTVEKLQPGCSFRYFVTARAWWILSLSQIIVITGADGNAASTWSRNAMKSAAQRRPSR